MGHRIVAAATLGPHEEVMTRLEAAGCAVDRLPPETSGWTPALIAEFAPRAEAYVGTFRGIGLPRAVIEASPLLRVITSPIIGTEYIDVDAATELGIPVAHGAMPENFDGMAEAGAMLVATLIKQLPQKIDALRAGRWKPVPVGQMVKGATVGLLGFGRIGRGIARRLDGWGCRLIAHDPYVDPAAAAAHGAELVTFESLVAEADVLLVLVTLTAETRHIIDAKAIGRMKPDAYLVNIGRGGCVDEAALIEALDADRLAGAAIDTWEEEPPPLDHPLRNHPRVIATGHNVGHSAELYASIPVTAAENTMRALRGEEPLHVRNPAALPKWRERLAAMAEGVE